MANTSISNLSAGAAVAATDVMPNVQTAGVGPVKTTAAQFKTFMSASPTLVTPTLGVAAGTSIALGGATIGSNALAVTGTVAVTGDPTFTCTFPVFTSTSAFLPQMSVWNQNNGSSGPYLNIKKSRGGTTAVQAADTLGTVIFQGLNSGNTISNGSYVVSVVESVGASSVTSRIEFINVNAAPIIFGIPGEVMRVASTSRVGIGNNSPLNKLDITGSFGRGAPVTKTGNFSLADTENWVIVNQAGTTTVTLPAASSWTGREVMIKTITANTVVSAGSNVVPLAGGAAGTGILTATAGKWATLVSDGSNWVIMAAA
jgi:hypothetical protein